MKQGVCMLCHSKNLLFKSNGTPGLIGLPSGGLVNIHPRVISTIIIDEVTIHAVVSFEVWYIAAAIIVASAPAATCIDAAKPCAAACLSSGTETDTSMGPAGKLNPSLPAVITVIKINANTPSTNPKVETKIEIIARLPTAHLLAPKR